MADTASRLPCCRSLWPRRLLCWPYRWPELSYVARLSYPLRACQAQLRASCWITGITVYPSWDSSALSRSSDVARFGLRDVLRIGPPSKGGHASPTRLQPRGARGNLPKFRLLKLYAYWLSGQQKTRSAFGLAGSWRTDSRCGIYAIPLRKIPQLFFSRSTRPPASVRQSPDRPDYPPPSSGHAWPSIAA